MKQPLESCQVDREYFNEVALLQQHWLFESSWALVYADRLVPRLGQVEMSELGQIHLEPLSTAKILREFDDMQLMRALPRLTDQAREEPATAPAIDHTVIDITEASDTMARDPLETFTSGSLLRPPSAVANSPHPAPDGSRTLARIDEDAPGHTTAAVLQRLRRPPESSLDLEMNLRLLDHDEEEEDPTQVEELISRQPSKGLEAPTGGRFIVRSRSPSDIGEPVPETAPPVEPDFSMFQPTPQPAPVVLSPPSGIPPRAPGPTPSKPPDSYRRGSDTGNGEILTPLKRIPGYRYDSVVRIRSEPYSGLLDAAQLERFMHSDSNNALMHKASMSVGDIGGSVDSMVMAASPDIISPRDGDGIPRTMSVPNYQNRRDLNSFAHLGDADDYNRITPTPSPVRAKDREGEILIMVINTMRQLYKRMYEQSFISGTVYIGFMATADVVTDFALVNVSQKSQIKAWKEVFAAHGADGYRGAAGELNDNLHRVAEDYEDHKTCLGSVMKKRKRQPNERLQEILENITGFEVEWILTAGKLRRNGPPTRWIRMFKKLCCCCCRRQERRRLSTSLSSLWASRSMPRWQRILRAVWTSLWSAVGPRQTFPALDDLQLLCAFVDVHDELLLRGDTGLRTMLGPRLLSAYQEQTRKAKLMILRLADAYPDSFSYAMICHAALFLVNLKIQLVEEQYERGLLLADDKEKIAGLLKQQLVSITKFHPPFLFT
eukprot:Blabericola_migrator_1__4962@NODE_2583_length_2574_cov_541_213004_g1042_i1_p1_GENE_NODE_2583_length_2574_cov_541_213004_g1042_i1NODE_2583_length_2574_cov_541_213004_g1042_i1_p1_ORF_typecomplete_len719_score132_40_NODE_2583_length_2574_cov_541_213004_g1042_i13372493